MKKHILYFLLFITSLTYGQSTLDFLTPNPWNPKDAFGNSLVYWLEPSNTSTMMQENSTNSTPVTDVTIDTNPIGLFYDQGVHCFFATAQSDATRPTLSSDLNRNSFVTFNGTTQRITVPNTQKYLNPFQSATSTAWGILFWVKINAANGVSVVIADNSEFNTTGNSGFSIFRATTNKLVFKITYSSPGNYKVNRSSTADLISSTGWVPVMIYSTGNGVNALHLQIGNNAEDLATVAAVGTVNDCFANLFFGCNPNTSTFGGFSLGTFVAINRIPTANEWEQFKLYNPPRNTDSWQVNTVEYDFNNPLKGWADVAKTIQITNGVAFRAWEPEIASIFGPLNRDITTSSAAVSAIWTTNLQNGLSGLVYDGIDDQSNFTSAFIRERGGKYVEYGISRNLRANLGSHWLSSGLGTNYQPSTGSTYPSGAHGVGTTYFVTHAVIGTTSGSIFKNLIEGPNILMERRNGINWTSTSGLNVLTNSNTATGAFSCTQIGAASIAGWQAQGYHFKVALINGTLSNSFMTSTVDFYNTLYGM